MATSPASPNGGGTVKFQTNVPETVSLAFAEGRDVTSNYSGDQVMFTLDDGRRMYLAPFVADKIRAAGIRAHEPFEICRREVTQGNRRTVEFQIRPMQGRSLPGNQSPASAAALPAPPATASVALPDYLGGLFVECGKQAIDALLTLEQYAHERGLKDFASRADVIERIAVHLSIGAQQRGSR